MKPFLISIQFFVLSSAVFSQQCPPSALKIQSPICDTPKNLNVNNIKCTTTQLSWQGSKEQNYIVTATVIDNAGNALFEIDSANYACNESGNCTSTINVKEGTILNWNVQAICNIKGATIYSPKVEGKETVIPYCKSITAEEKSNIIKNSETVRVYPNPTTGYLNVEYYSKASGVVRLKVIDINGKTVINTSANASQGNNKYSLNLQTLLPGTYILELSNNRSVNKTKFVLVNK